jgi:hypothetical protein
LRWEWSAKRDLDGTTKGSAGETALRSTGRIAESNRHRSHRRMISIPRRPPGRQGIEIICSMMTTHGIPGHDELRATSNSFNHTPHRSGKERERGIYRGRGEAANGIGSSDSDEPPYSQRHSPSQGHTLHWQPQGHTLHSQLHPRTTDTGHFRYLLEECNSLPPGHVTGSSLGYHLRVPP